jgi:hypothetical protein
MAILAKIEIVLEDTGNVGVSFPVEQKMLCYGMMEEAKNLIRAYQKPLVTPAVVVPGTPPGLNGSEPGKHPPLRRI